jgi:hypothetical protein
VPTDTSAVVRIRLIIGDRVATATLDDTAPARDFAAMLPVTTSMHDLFGREKPAGCLASSTSAALPGNTATTSLRSPTGRRATTSRSSTLTTASPSRSPVWSASAPSTPAWT